MGFIRQLAFILVNLTLKVVAQDEGNSKQFQDVPNITSLTFNRELAKKPHFIMFYEHG